MVKNSNRKQTKKTIETGLYFASTVVQNAKICLKYLQYLKIVKEINIYQIRK